MRTTPAATRSGQAEAKARQGERHDLENIPLKSAECSGESADIAGKQVGVGRTMIQKAKQVKTGDAELFQQVKRGADGIHGWR